jgi:hypothetical protein
VFGPISASAALAHSLHHFFSHTTQTRILFTSIKSQLRWGTIVLLPGSRCSSCFFYSSRAPFMSAGQPILLVAISSLFPLNTDQHERNSESTLVGQGASLAQSIIIEHPTRFGSVPGSIPGRVTFRLPKIGGSITPQRAFSSGFNAGRNTGSGSRHLSSDANNATPPRWHLQGGKS